MKYISIHKNTVFLSSVKIKKIDLLKLFSKIQKPTNLLKTNLKRKLLKKFIKKIFNKFK